MDEVKSVFETIRKIRPTVLFLSSDGPRQMVEDEKETVQLIRNYVASNIDWPCQIHKSFKNENLGCGINVKTSIDWFFETVEYGVILEDDCLPLECFYSYAEELLHKYRNDSRIGMISGVNHFVQYYQCEESYLFSTYKSCWGWATWKRAWEHCDLEMNWYHTPQRELIIKNMGYGFISKVHWKNAIRKIHNNVVDTWDWQWYFTLASQNQLCIFPEKNLVSNIGFNSNATNTSGISKKRYLVCEPIKFPLNHPDFIISDKNFDNIFEKKKLLVQICKDFFPPKFKKIVKSVYFQNKRAKYRYTKR